MASKIKIKIGNVELEYEGDETFLKQEVPEIVRALSAVVGPKQGSVVANSQDEKQKCSNGEQLLSVSTIAAKLGSKSGPELIVAACAKLSFVDNSTTFSRDQILNEMQTATSHYKESFRKNLTQNLNTLVRNQDLNQVSADRYALPEDKKKELENQFASN